MGHQTDINEHCVSPRKLNQVFFRRLNRLKLTLSVTNAVSSGLLPNRNEICRSCCWSALMSCELVFPFTPDNYRDNHSWHYEDIGCSNADKRVT